MGGGMRVEVVVLHSTSSIDWTGHSGSSGGSSGGGMAWGSR